MKSKHPKGWTPNKQTPAIPPQLAKMAAEVMDLLSKRTEHGIVFHTDARLRPDGEKGLLVNTLEAYKDYYEQRAALWEIQTLTRTRAVAGDANTGASFQKLAAAMTDFRRFDDPGSAGVSPASSSVSTRPTRHRGAVAPNRTTNEDVPLRPAAYTRSWKQEIHRMRMRIEKERTPVGKDDLAIKTGKGGLVDAEFVAQALCLENGWPEPNTLRALQMAAHSESVQYSAVSIQSKRQRKPNSKFDVSSLIDSYRKLRRVEGILRRWSYEGETVLPDDPAPYYRVAVRCGFATAEEFRNAVKTWRDDIRAGHAHFFGKG